MDCPSGPAELHRHVRISALDPIERIYAVNNIFLSRRFSKASWPVRCCSRWERGSKDDNNHRTCSHARERWYLVDYGASLSDASDSCQARHSSRGTSDRRGCDTSAPKGESQSHSFDAPAPKPNARRVFAPTCGERLRYLPAISKHFALSIYRPTSFDAELDIER